MLVCKNKFVGACIIKRREVVVRIRSEKLNKDWYREGYTRSLEGKRVEWDGDDNVKHMWEQVKQAMDGSAKEVYGSLRVGERTQKESGGMLR